MQLVVIAGPARRLDARPAQLPAGSCCWAWCSASPAPLSPSLCRWRRNGIRRASGHWRWASPAPAIPARCSPRCSRRPGGSFRLAQRARPGGIAARRGVRLLSPRGQGQPQMRRRARPSPITGRLLRIARRLVVHVLLQRHFGGFVGLASSLPIYFNDQYGSPPVTRRLFHRGLRLRRLAGAADRRRASPTASAASRALTVVYAVVGRRIADRRQRRPAALLAGAWRHSSSRMMASAWAMARCSSSCRSVSGARSA